MESVQIHDSAIVDEGAQIGAGSPVKATAEIGFTADIDLDDSLKRLIDWRAAHKSEVDARRKAVWLT